LEVIQLKINHNFIAVIQAVEKKIQDLITDHSKDLIIAGIQDLSKAAIIIITGLVAGIITIAQVIIEIIVKVVIAITDRLITGIIVREVIAIIDLITIIELADSSKDVLKILALTTIDAQ